MANITFLPSRFSREDRERYGHGRGGTRKGVFDGKDAFSGTYWNRNLASDGKGKKRKDRDNPCHNFHPLGAPVKVVIGSKDYALKRRMIIILVGNTNIK